MQITREYYPVASLAAALPVTVTVAVNFIQIDSRNPDLSMRAPLDHLRLEPSTYAGVPVIKVSGEASKDQWWQVTLSAEDGTELDGLVAKSRLLGQL